MSIKLLDKAITLYSNGNESAFCEMICIKGSTVRTWRLRGGVPDDKVVLLKALIQLHEAQAKLAKYEQYFDLQNDLLNCRKTEQ